MAKATTALQVQAVYEVMRLLRDDDRQRGITTEALAPCATCHRRRPAAGAVHYGAVTLCNGCATDYELLRLARLAPPLPQ